jgi:mannitol 2-dehydrogenase
MICDTVERVNRDAALNYLLDPVRDRLAQGGSIELLGLAVAAWMRRVSGVDEDGNMIVVKHPLADLLRVRARKGEGDPAPLLQITSLFGNLGENMVFVRVVRKWLESLYEVGVQKTLATLN